MLADGSGADAGVRNGLRPNVRSTLPRPACASLEQAAPLPCRSTSVHTLGQRLAAVRARVGRRSRCAAHPRRAPSAWSPYWPRRSSRELSVPSGTPRMRAISAQSRPSPNAWGPALGHWDDSQAVRRPATPQPSAHRRGCGLLGRRRVPPNRPRRAGAAPIASRARA